MESFYERKEPLRLFVLEFVSLIQKRQLKEEASIDSTQDNIAPASLKGAPFILFTLFMQLHTDKLPKYVYNVWITCYICLIV